MIPLTIETLVAVLFTLLAGGCALLVIAGLPGSWIMIAAAIAVDCLDSMWLAPGTPLTFHPLSIAAAAFVAGVGELLEFMLSAYGAKRFGASRAGMIGSVIGSTLGAIAGTLLIPIPIAGTLIGAIAGAAIGAIIGELRSGKKSLRDTAGPATGAVIGRVLGTAAKLPCAIAVLAILVAAAWN